MCCFYRHSTQYCTLLHYPDARATNPKLPFRQRTSRTTKELVWILCSSSLCSGMTYGRKMDGWVRVLHPFNSISVISRWWKGEHERLCAMKHRLGSGRISPPMGFEPVTPWSEVGALTARPRGHFNGRKNIPVLQFFYLGFTAQDYFTNFQSPEKNHLTLPELDWSHVIRDRLKLTTVRWQVIMSVKD